MQDFIIRGLSNSNYNHLDKAQVSKTLPEYDYIKHMLGYKGSKH